MSQKQTELDIMEHEWEITLDPPPSEKRSFFCRIGLHMWKQFTHLQAKQTVTKCVKCGDEWGRRRI